MTALRWLLAMAALTLPLTSCSSNRQSTVSWQCRVISGAAWETPSDTAQGYGVISMTVRNMTGQPWDPYSARVYVFRSAGVQDGTAQIPDSSSGPVAPGATETFTGGDLWPVADTCSLS